MIRVLESLKTRLKPAPDLAVRTLCSEKSMSSFTIRDGEKDSYTTDFLQYLNESSTAFHATRGARNRFLAAGFQEINETEAWSISKGGRYFFTRNGTTVFAFTVGDNYAPGNGFNIAAAHTDSPHLRLKAVPTVTKSKSLMLNTQPYGGGLWHTWFDRDLGIAGRVVVRNNSGVLESRLIDIRRPVARIPNLAIHLTKAGERDSFAPNLHSHAQALLSVDPASVAAADEGRFHPALMVLVAPEAGCKPEDVVEMELQLIDTQGSCLGGLHNEFIYSGRLDNLCSAYQCIRSLIDTPMENSANIRIIMLFDHEEVGSSSAQGAGSSMFMDTLQSIHEALNGPSSHSSLMRDLRNSFVVSIDMAHALHPNYTEKHDHSMAPIINGGLVIKHNANQRYATNAMSASVFRECARQAGVPVQEFSVRSDSGCGR